MTDGRNDLRAEKMGEKDLQEIRAAHARWEGADWRGYDRPVLALQITQRLPEILAHVDYLTRELEDARAEQRERDAEVLKPTDDRLVPTRMRVLRCAHATSTGTAIAAPSRCSGSRRGAMWPLTPPGHRSSLAGWPEPTRWDRGAYETLRSAANWLTCAPRLIQPSPDEWAMQSAGADDDWPDACRVQEASTPATGVAPRTVAGRRTTQSGTTGGRAIVWDRAPLLRVMAK